MNGCYVPHGAGLDWLWSDLISLGGAVLVLAVGITGVILLGRRDRRT